MIETRPGFTVIPRAEAVAKIRLQLKHLRGDPRAQRKAYFDKVRLPGYVTLGEDSPYDPRKNKRHKRKALKRFLRQIYLLPPEASP